MNRAVRLTRHGIQTVTEPRPARDGVRVRVTSSGICGSDLHAAKGGPSAAARLLARHSELPDLLVTHRFGLGEAAAAFAAAGDRSLGAIKVHVLP